MSAAFYLDQPTRILGVYGWMNGFGYATVGITNDERSLWFGHSFVAENVENTPAKWQGVSSLQWDLPVGDYRVELQGAEYPFAYGGPPGTAPQQPTDYQILVEGEWQSTPYPFGVRIYGVPLSTVPEPATYGAFAALLLGGAAAIQRRRRWGAKA